MLRCVACVVALLVPAVPVAQPGPAADPCPEGVAVGTLEGSDVRARLFTNGNLFYGGSFPHGETYQTPLTGEDADKSPLSMANLWVGARAAGEVRVTAAGFVRFAMRPGATGADGTPPTPAECAAADRIVVVSRHDIERFLADGTLTDDLRDWPVHLGAPVLDGDGVEGNYDLAAGDQPAIRGDVTAFWAMTDTARPDLGMGLPVGVDVAVEAFTYRNLPPAPSPASLLGSMTAYRVTVTNRSGVRLDSLHLGLFVQHEIGKATSSYVGTDTARHMAIGYKPTNADERPFGYRIQPAFGLVVADSPVGADGAPVGMSAMRFFENVSAGPTVDPGSAPGAFHSLAGRWADGTPMRERGNGYGPQAGAPVTRYAFTGDPVAGAYWSERNNDGNGTANPSGQRRLMPSSGPVTLAPDASAAWTLAILFAQGTDHLDSVVRLRGRADQFHALQAVGAFEPQRVVAGPPQPPAPPVPAAIRRPAPNPFTGATTLRLDGLAGQTITVRVLDALGRTVEQRTVAPAGDGVPVTVGAGLAAGAYVVRVEGRDIGVTLPVVKTR